MKLTLQELLEQKRLLEQHLKWLEVKISEKRDEAPTHSGVEPEPKGAATPTEKPKPYDSASREQTALPDSHQFERPFEVTEVTKLGCWAFAIGAMALFLFLLFGLPYFIK